MDHVEFTYTAGMDEEAVGRRLSEAETGVLALADDGEAYAIPIAFSYGDGSILFRFGTEGESEKIDLIETTETACFVVYDYSAPRDSWSVLARGPLRVLEGAERDGVDEAEINERFPPLRVFDEPVDDIELVLVELSIDELTGRETLR